MLVLSRRINERLFLDSNIRISVLGIRGNKVRLGVEAPGWVTVVREELIAPGDRRPDESNGHPPG
jgi:carbon storage regulator